MEGMKTDREVLLEMMDKETAELRASREAMNDAMSGGVRVDTIPRSTARIPLPESIRRALASLRREKR